MYIFKINNKIYSSKVRKLNYNFNNFNNLNRVYILINNKFIKLIDNNDSILNITNFGSKILYYNIATNICNFNNVIYFMIVYNNSLRQRNYNVQNNTLNNKLILFNAIDTISLDKYNVLINQALSQNIISKLYIHNAISYKKKNIIVVN